MGDFNAKDLLHSYENGQFPSWYASRKWKHMDSAADAVWGSAIVKHASMAEWAW